jgi:hypothetical protein
MWASRAQLPGLVRQKRVRATDNVSNVGEWAEASVSVVQVTKYYHFGG